MNVWNEWMNIGLTVSFFAEFLVHVSKGEEPIWAYIEILFGSVDGGGAYIEILFESVEEGGAYIEIFFESLEEGGAYIEMCIVV